MSFVSLIRDPAFTRLPVPMRRIVLRQAVPPEKAEELLKASLDVPGQEFLERPGPTHVTLHGKGGVDRILVTSKPDLDRVLRRIAGGDVVLNAEGPAKWIGPIRKASGLL